MEIFEQAILNSISKKLIKKKQTVAVAESVTSGLLQFAFSNMKDAKDFFQGGITAYNVGQKTKHLLVEPIHAAAADCVSPAVSLQMAASIQAMFHAHWSIGITGYATPSRRQSLNEVYAYYAICYNKDVVYQNRIVPPAAAPMLVQISFANAVLSSFDSLL